MEERCEVVVEVVEEEQCSVQDSVEYGEECEDVETEQCVNTQQWTCEDDDEDDDEYGSPRAPLKTVG